MRDEGALNDLWPLVNGDARLEGDGGRVVAPARAEHRLRVGADPMGVARLDARGRDALAARPEVTVASLPFVDPSKDIPKS